MADDKKELAEDVDSKIEAPAAKQDPEVETEIAEPQPDEDAKAADPQNGPGKIRGSS